MTSRILTLAATILSFFSTPIAAQDYPDRTIRLAIPQNPGGTTDALARIFATSIGKELGEEIVLDHRSGAGNIVGTQMVAEAEPDGYTLGVGSAGSLAISPLTQTEVPYDPSKDFAAVYNFANVPNVLVVNPELGVKTVDELVEVAKERTGELNYASGGAGGATPFRGRDVRRQAGIADKVVHIPYQGGSQGSVAVASGEVQIYVGPLAGGLIGVIESGKVIPLAVSGNKRVAALKDVPTFAEAGLPDYKSVGWFGIVAPAGTPTEIVARLNDVANAVAKSPEVIAALAAQGIEPVENSPKEFDAQIQSDIEMYRALMEEGVVKLN